MDNLILVGTTHLTPKQEILGKIAEYKPEVIGVELCKTRLHIMLSGVNQVANPNDKSIMGKISNAIRKKAEEEKIEYGSDQITASRFAIENNIPLVLVDRPAEEINALMQKIPQNEAQGFMKELQDFQSKSLQSSAKEVSEEETIFKLKTYYPVAYEFLIAGRETYIISQIQQAMLKYPNKKIMVFLGKGHVKSIQEKFQ